MKKKRKLFIICICVLLVLVCFSLYILKPKKIFYLEFGDDFSWVNIYEDNKKSKLDEDKINLVFYLSDTCNPCIQQLNLISIIDSLDFFADFSINIIWENNIPLLKLNKYDFKNVKNYTLKGKVYLTGTTPHFYIIDKNKVIYETGMDNIDKIIDDILKLSNKDEVEYQYKIFKNLCDINGFNVETTSLILLTENCQGCKKWEDYIKENQENKNLILILDYQTEDYKNYIYDKFGFFKKIFDINIFPSAFNYQKKVKNNISLEDLY